MSERTLSGEAFFAHLRRHGFDFFTGVPCSLLEGLYPALESQTEVPYVEAVREDEAVGQAAGAYLAGRKPVVLMQNSGLGNSLNAIVSLSQIYRTPFLLLVTWRGFEGKDAPEHLVMGEAMTRILDSLHLPYDVLDPAQVERQLARACRELTAGRPTALIVKKGVLV